MKKQKILNIFCFCSLLLTSLVKKRPSIYLSLYYLSSIIYNLILQ